MSGTQKRALVMFSPGFEEIELVTIVDVLRRAGVNVTLGGTQAGSLAGSHGLRIEADTTLTGLNAGQFDAVILPGGMPNSRTLAEHLDCQRIIKEARQGQKLLGAICAAPIALKAAGVIGNSKLTSHPSVQSDLAAPGYLLDRVVRDGKLITSRGPGTAMEFALALVSELCGQERAEELMGPMLVKQAAATS